MIIQRPIPQPSAPCESDLDQAVILATGMAMEQEIPNVESQTTMEQMDTETMDMCQRKGLLQYIRPILDMIESTYSGLTDINLERIEDPEDPGYEKLCIEIHLASEPDQVLDDEDAFYDAFFSKIPQDKRNSFVFIYQVS